MKPRKIVTVVLLIFVVASLAFLLFKGTGTKTESAGQTETETGPETDKATAESGEHRVIAYYFHTAARCPTCIRIESYTKATIETLFADRIEAGTLSFLSVNLEEPGNEHYIGDYHLTTKSVVLSEYRGGEQVRWKNLDRVWEFAGDRDRFVKYIESETRGFLGEPMHE
jgi:hypothetical protein